MNTLLTKIIETADRNTRIINALSLVWFVISTASWIPFLPIPEIPYVTDRNFWVSSAIWNTLWWGFAHPIIANHREKMKALDTPPGKEPPIL